MRLASNTVLISGGATGIGYALAERFLAAGSEVIVCGRRAAALEAARARLPRLHPRGCDLSREDGRQALAEWVVREFPALNVLVNNAGIQRRVGAAAGESWAATHEEIAINFEAPLHLTRLLLPHLAAQPRAAVVNITSGLAFVPMAIMPVYCATKAALHSYTLTLRRQLAGTRVEVIEIVPPAVNTDLGGPGLHAHATPLAEFADAAAAQLDTGATEICFGGASAWSRIGRVELDAAFERLNARVPGA